ncbi:hypothetical protein GCM10023321_37470 [Pseudonocardia eucalypti]|uniref:Pentapeptide repeat-containing protein n=1 Tax=Pseudonocardia eucalypti TaxID=648755 RepID=A0ABP9Q7X3_9PSEU|nr:hypothetical protein [Pseudonocardia eucalypti]
MAVFTDDFEPTLRHVTDADLLRAAVTIDAPAPFGFLGVSRRSTRKAARQLISSLRDRERSRKPAAADQQPTKPDSDFRAASPADLATGKLHRADLAGLTLDGARLGGADLSLANLEGTSLQRADLGQANLTEARLQQANLSDARLVGAKLVLAKMRGAVLRGADLRGASLYGADLIAADFTGANVENAVFMGAEWEPTSTRFSADLYEQLWTASVEIAPGVYKVGGAPQRELVSSERA